MFLTSGVLVCFIVSPKPDLSRLEALSYVCRARNCLNLAVQVYLASLASVRGTLFWRRLRISFLLYVELLN